MKIRDALQSHQKLGLLALAGLIFCGNLTLTQTAFLCGETAKMKDIDNPRVIYILQRADASWGDKITRL